MNHLTSESQRDPRSEGKFAEKIVKQRNTQHHDQIVSIDRSGISNVSSRKWNKVILNVWKIGWKREFLKRMQKGPRDPSKGQKSLNQNELKDQYDRSRIDQPGRVSHTFGSTVAIIVQQLFAFFDIALSDQDQVVASIEFDHLNGRIWLSLKARMARKRSTFKSLLKSATYYIVANKTRPSITCTKLRNINLGSNS